MIAPILLPDAINDSLAESAKKERELRVELMDNTDEIKRLMARNNDICEEIMRLHAYEDEMRDWLGSQ